MSPGDRQPMTPEDVYHWDQDRQDAEQNDADSRNDAEWSNDHESSRRRHDTP